MSYIDELLKALTEDDREKEMFLMKDKTPYQTRDAFGKVLNTHINQNYDISKPEDVKKLWTPGNRAIETAQIQRVSPELMGNAKASFLESKNLVKIPNSVPLSDITADIAHDLGHVDDFGDKNPIYNNLKQAAHNQQTMVDEMPMGKYNRMTGLANAERVLENHHMGSSFFERDAIKKLIKGGKLAVSGIAPILKGGALAAAAYQVAGLGQKAMAGDLEGAASDAGEIGVDVAMGAYSSAKPSIMGDAELPETEMKKRIEFNELHKKLQGK